MPYKKGNIPWNAGTGIDRKEYSREWHREYIEKHGESASTTRGNKHKENGLCYRCCRPRIEGSILCLFHASYNTQANRKYRKQSEKRQIHNEYGKERYHKLKLENKCVTCGMSLNEESRMGIWCLTCYSKKKGFI